jgi:hypothetical protein
MITKEEYEEAQEIVWQYEEQLKNNGVLDDVSQQRELLIATIEKVRYNLDGYGALTSSEIAERLEKAINCG